MTDLYMLTTLICGIFTAYIGFRTFRLWFRPAAEKHIEFCFYSVFTVICILFPLTQLHYTAGCLTVTVSCICAAFLYRGKRTVRLTVSVLISAVLILVDYGLTQLSAAVHFGFYNPAYSSALTGRVLYVIILWLLHLLCAFGTDFFCQRKVNLLQLAAALFAPLTALYLIAVNLLIDINVKNLPSSLRRHDFLARLDSLDLTFYSSAAALILGTLLLIFLYDRSMQISKMKMQQLFMAKQNDAYHQQLLLMHSAEDRIRTLRHDMRNHLSVLRALSVSENTEAAISYIDTLTDNLQTASGISSTGIIAVDSLINCSFLTMQDCGITFDYSPSIPSTLSISDYDLTVILGNLTDNAREACLKLPTGSRHIRLSLRCKKNCLIIRISNTFDGNVKKQGEEFLSTKDQPQLHGIGLKNIKSTAEKYDGITDITYDRKKFTVTVILSL